MTLNEASLEKKFENATNSQDSIQGLSLWILHHKNHHKRIVQIWMKTFEKGLLLLLSRDELTNDRPPAKASHRLTLFYLANDVIQHAKRKGVTQYLDDFAEILRSATNLVRGEKIAVSVNRVLNIWQERNVYTEEFIDELKAILSGSNFRSTAVSKIVAEFKLDELIEKIRKLKKCETNSLLKLEQLNNCNLDAASCDVLNKLKDKTHGEQFSKDFDDATKCLETAIGSLEKEVASRVELVGSLDKSQVFYETQKDEAKVVMNAYKNFGLRVKSVKKKLEETRTSLPSPLPSPPKDAPSPSSDEGPRLPGRDFKLEMAVLLNIARGETNKQQQQQQHGTSLDQRLSNLMCTIPQLNEQQKIATSNMHTSQQNSASYSNHWNSSDYSMSQSTPSNYGQEMAYPMPPPVNSQMSYDYNYVHHLNDGNRQNDVIQPIQSLISSRQDEGNKLVQTPQVLPINMYDFGVAHQAPENFEPADMDLGNSDEEDNNRLQSQQRNLKVIDTRRPNEHQMNGSNYDQSFNHNISYAHSFSGPSQLKSIARMPVHSPINSQSLFSQPQQQQPVMPHPWRGPRSTVMPQSRFSPSHSHPTNTHQHNRWRGSNRNNPSNNNNNNNNNSNLRKIGGFRRY